MSSSGSSIWTQLGIIALLTMINAVFAASEIAFVSVNQNKLKTLAEEGNKSAARVLSLLGNSDDFLATIQVAITLAGFLSSASAATSFGDVIVKIFPHVPGIGAISVFVVTLVLSYISLVFGELFPKQVALQMPEKVAMMTSGVVKAVQTVFKPFVFLLSASTGLLQRITPIDFTQREERFTRDEMQAIMAESSKQGSIDVEELTMLEGVLSLDDTLAREVMVPRTDTEMIDIDEDNDDIIDQILSSPYSRLPVYQDDKDNVIGVIHIKNVLREAARHGLSSVNIQELATEPLFVPSIIYIDDLLLEFKREQNHMAILRDEYGGVEGIVTMEDVLEEIVGEIEDESDIDVVDEVQQLDADHYYLNGVLSLEKFCLLFNEEIESDEVDTIAGYFISQIGYVPDDDEVVSLRIEDYVLETDVVQNGRIRGIRVTRDADRLIEAEYDYRDEEELTFDEILDHHEQSQSNHD